MTEETSASQLAIEQFIERNGMQAEACGVPRIAGRLIGLFLLDGGPISFSELAVRLQASRASVSTNTRLLERLGIIERVSLRGQRQDFFQLRSNPYVLAVEHSMRESQRFSCYVDELMKNAELSEDAKARVLAAQTFHQTTAKALEDLLLTLEGSEWNKSSTSTSS